MQRKLALLGVTLAVLALVLGFVLLRRTGPVAPVAREPASSETRDPASAAAVADAESPGGKRAEASVRAESAAPMHVRSSAGIPLPFVEIEREGGWQRVELVGGECDSIGVKWPATLRAPGHVARLLESAMADVVLEPDALLSIEAPDLRACLAECGIEDDGCRRLSDWREARTRAIAADWISPTRFGIAAACDRLEPLPAELHVVLVRANQKRLHLVLGAIPRLRGRWEMPCEVAQARTPLEVHVNRPAGRSGPVLLLLESSSNPESAAPQASFAWGSVSEESSESDGGQMLAEGEAVAHFPLALSGRRHVLAALDESTHAYGRLEFVHDGSPRRITLRDAFEIRGRVVDATGHAPLDGVNLHMDGLGANGWVLNRNRLKLDESGGFVVRAPDRPPIAMRNTLDPPNKFTVEVTLAGYRRARFLFARSDPLALDVGELALVRQ